MSVNDDINNESNLLVDYTMDVSRQFDTWLSIKELENSVPIIPTDNLFTKLIKDLEQAKKDNIFPCKTAPQYPTFLKAIGYSKDGYTKYYDRT